MAGSDTDTLSKKASDFTTVNTNSVDLTWFDQLPALGILAPLLCAALVVVIFHRGFAIRATQLVCVFVFYATVSLYLQAQSQAEPIVYYMGGWLPPYGINLHLDLLNTLVGMLLGLIAMCASFFIPQSTAVEIDDEKVPFFCSAFLLCLSGLLGITYSGDAFNIFVFLEISSLASYTLIAIGRDRRALTAAFQYLIMGTIGATFILIGIGFLYAMTGTLNITDIHDRLAGLDNSNTVRTAFSFLTVGIALKAAVFPLHLWLNNAYSYAPSVVTAFIAATATKVSVYLFFRFFFTLFGYEHSFSSVQLNWILIPLSILGIAFGTYKAFFLSNVKSILASSSVAHVGYMTLGIGIATQTSLAGSMVHMFNHGLMKGLLFLSIAGFMLTAQGSLLHQIQGLGRRYPLLGVGMSIGGLSLIGVPLTAGFTGKLLLLQAAAESGYYFILAFILLASVGALFYTWRFLSAIWFGEMATLRADAQSQPDPLPWTYSPLNLLALIGLVIMIVANLYFGIFTEQTIFVADKAAELLIGAGGQ